MIIIDDDADEPNVEAGDHSSGAVALAPTVDHPKGFAVQNMSGQALTISFAWDSSAHVMKVIIEGERAVVTPPADQLPH